ncbi:hypothetical protein [Paenibacillus jiagnxiensis]
MEKTTLFAKKFPEIGFKNSSAQKIYFTVDSITVYIAHQKADSQVNPE